MYKLVITDLLTIYEVPGTSKWMVLFFSLF